MGLETMANAWITNLKLWMVVGLLLAVGFVIIGLCKNFKIMSYIGWALVFIAVITVIGMGMW